MKTHIKTGICSIAMGVLMVGCGEKPADVTTPPAQPAPAPDVTVTANNDVSAPPPGAPNQPPPPPGVAAPIPTADDGAPKDIFKGMSARDVEDYKANATPETHDMNLTPLTEAIIGFNAEFRRYPNNIEELVKARYLARVLYAPKGKKYNINPKTGEITVE